MRRKRIRMEWWSGGEGEWPLSLSDIEESRAFMTLESEGFFTDGRTFSLTNRSIDISFSAEARPSDPDTIMCLQLTAHAKSPPRRRRRHRRREIQFPVQKVRKIGFPPERWEQRRGAATSGGVGRVASRREVALFDVPTRIFFPQLPCPQYDDRSTRRAVRWLLHCRTPREFRRDPIDKSCTAKNSETEPREEIR